MNYDGSFGGRPAPSLAEAMMSAQRGYSSMNSPCTTPNAFAGSYYTRRVPSYSQQPIGCGFGSYNRRVEEVFDSDEDIDDDNYSKATNSITYEQEEKKRNRQSRIMKKVEETVCNKLESTLNQHYKLVKAKLKNVQQKVESTDASIERLSKLLDSVTECVYSLPEISIVQATSPRQSQSISFTQPVARPSLTWRRKKSTKGRRIQSQSEMDSLYF